MGASARELEELFLYGRRRVFWDDPPQNYWLELVSQSTILVDSKTRKKMLV